MIVPVEIWDLPSDGRLLQERRADPDFAERLAAALDAWDPPHRFDRVHVMGGDAATAADAIARRWPTTVDADPFAPVIAAGRPCADLGQTSLKLWTRRRIPRDLARAPFRDGVPPADRAAARASTIAWIRSFLAGIELLAIPCEITAAGPRSCSYCFADPDRALAAELGVELVNDAVLAARAAPPIAGTLVVTVGFGVGGALIA